MALDYWYDAQLRNYLMQFTRIFSVLQYETGVGKDGTKVLKTVPVRFFSNSRQAMHIIRNNSENIINSVPQFVCYLQSIQRSPDRIQDPSFVNHQQVFERKIDQNTGRYTSELGNTYTVERYMPVPYELTVKMELWVSNEDQKLQLMEQIMVLFNPSIDLQTSVNPLDWIGLTQVYLEEIEYSSRGVAIGTEDDIETASMIFRIPIFISPPVKIKKQNIINQIVLNIANMQDVDTSAYGGVLSASDVLARTVITPGNHQLRISNNSGILLNANGAVEDNGIMLWKPLLDQYGEIRLGKSKIELKTTKDIEDTESSIFGIIEDVVDNIITITYDQNTLPSSTLLPINGILDPTMNFPGKGLPTPVVGDRYIITTDISPDTVAWNGLRANMDDIIEYGNSGWFVSFSAINHPNKNYLINNRNNKLLEWSGTTWSYKLEGDYYEGMWRIHL